jgi:hypothetical protein
MLSPEEGWARLDALRSPRWQDRADDRVGKPTRKFREPARAFLAPHPAYRLVLARSGGTGGGNSMRRNPRTGCLLQT